MPKYWEREELKEYIWHMEENAREVRSAGDLEALSAEKVIELASIWMGVGASTKEEAIAAIRAEY